jgi:DNA ligase-1
MKDPVVIVVDIEKAQGANAKKEIIKEHKDNEEFLYLLKVAFDPFFVTHLKELPEHKPKTPVIQHKFDHFKAVAELMRREGRNSKTLKAVQEFLNECSEIEADIYGRALTKNLKIGVGVKTINKVLDNFVPYFELMKATPVSDIKEIHFPILMEEKLDGVRCVVVFKDGVPTAMTYNNKPLHLPNIFKALSNLLEKEGEKNVVFDGELLYEKARTKTSSIVNRILKNDEGTVSDEGLVFHIFDAMPTFEFLVQACNINFIGRKTKLWTFMRNNKSKCLNYVESYAAHNWDEIETFFKNIIKEGGEGIILKYANSTYEFKRSKAWIKMKGVYSTTLRIVGTVEGKGKYKGMLGAFIAQTEDGKFQVEVGSGVTDEQRVSFAKGMEGNLIEVAFNGAHKTKDGELFIDFPVFKGLRMDKDKADTVEQMLKEIPLVEK